MTGLEREQAKGKFFDQEETRTAFGVRWRYNSSYGRWDADQPDPEGCEVRCGRCGGGLLRISYDEYACVATCSECGSTFIVYDG